MAIVSGSEHSAEQEVAAVRPRAERFVRAGVAGVDDPTAAGLDGICHAFVGVWNLRAAKVHAVARATAVAGRHLADRDREPEREEAVAEDRGEPRQQLHRAGGPDDVERLGPGRQLAIAPRVEQRRNVDDVVGVEVRDGENA